MTYAGVSADGHIAARLTVMTPRSDDINRAVHRLRYDVLAPTPFKRMAFYQLGADHYNDHQFQAMARGNASEVVEEWESAVRGAALLASRHRMRRSVPMVFTPSRGQHGQARGCVGKPGIDRSLMERAPRRAPGRHAPRRGIWHRERPPERQCRAHPAARHRGASTRRLCRGRSRACHHAGLGGRLLWRRTRPCDGRSSTVGTHGR